MNRQEYWNGVFTKKGERDVSWYESFPSVSLKMLHAAGLTRETCVLDVGGGDSHLIDHLTERGMDCVAVLDVSGAALAPESLSVMLGPEFALVESCHHVHQTPWLSPQVFQYSRFTRVQ